MNWHLFFGIIAWATLIITGLLNFRNIVVVIALLNEGKSVTIGWMFFGWIFIFVFALAYLVAR